MSDDEAPSTIGNIDCPYCGADLPITASVEREDAQTLVISTDTIDVEAHLVSHEMEERP